jgi:putative phosphoesterase
VRVVCLSDTHITRTGRRRLPDTARTALAGADAVIHAGDVVHPEVLDDLGRYGPVHAVLGNNDGELVGVLPTSLVVVLGGVRVGVTHDSGPRTGREARLGRRFPDADLVVFGHSHIPWNAAGRDGQWLLNPGSPTDKRRQPHHTLAVVEVKGGELVSTRIVELD